jgi:hypothetical protein
MATAPTENAGFEVARGSSTNTSILWNETTDKWTFTNDGTNYSDIGSAASESYANSAYLAANTADQRAVTSGVFANAAFGVANSASSYANGAFLAANTGDQKAVTSGVYANAAFDIANSASSYANGAFSAANTKLSTSGGTITGDLTISGNLTVSGCTATLTVETLRVHDSIVDVAYDVTGVPALDAGIRVVRGDSNPVLLKWNESIDKWTFTNDGTNYSNIGSAAAEDYANSAFATANASVNFITIGTANSASSYANSAFAAANASANFITLGTANSASAYANAAYLHANAAFAAANTGGGGGSGIDSYARDTANAAFIQANTSLSLNVAVDSFTGDGSNTAFTLSATPFNENFTIVTLDGISQHKSAYNVSSNILTFSAAPDTGVAIDVSTFYGGQQGSGQYQNRNYTGDGTTVNYTVSARTSANSLMVMENGIVQTPITDYTLAGTTLTFTTAPTTGTKIQIRELSYGSDSATVASSYANSAYLTANSGSSYANSAYIQANSAFSTANTKASTGKAIAMAIVFGF